MTKKKGSGLFGRLTPCFSVYGPDGKEKVRVLGNPDTGEITFTERIVIEPGDSTSMSFVPEKIPAEMKPN